jgi:hypothetical protein
MKLKKDWRNLSLEILENRNLGSYHDENSKLVNKCLVLRKKTLDQFTVEDIRIMIGQNMGLPYVLMLAIDILKDDLFVEGDLYTGDLLQHVLNVTPSFWIENKEIWTDVNNLIIDQLAVLNEQRISTAMFLSSMLR